MKIVMLGDIVGKPGRRVVQQQLPAVREAYAPDLVVANGENIAGGSGLTTSLFHRLTSYGIDGITLGDHVYRQSDLLPTLDSATTLVRPANLPSAAAGSRYMELTPPDGGPPLYVVTLLGRLSMSGPQADDPFAEIDRLLQELESSARVLVEIHAEATSEKVALGHHLDGRAVAVVGTHTHIPTADARILPHGTAYITDIGMSGPYDSVLGRRKDRVLYHMTTGMMARFDVAEEDPRLCGVYVEAEGPGHATRCERIERSADMESPPFT